MTVESIPTADTLVAKARSLRAALRDRQDETDALGRTPDATYQALREAGLFRVLQPRRFGGFELDLQTFHRIAIELARGCPSSGWVYALTAGHAHTLASWPEHVQAEVYGQDGHAVIPLSGLPGGKLTPSPGGGFRLSGAWDYSSGCEIGTHFIGVAMVVGEPPIDGIAVPRYALVDRTDYTIIDNWDVLGMRGTGSRRVVVDDVFVREDHVILAPSIVTPQMVRPGLSMLDNPLYSGPLLSFLVGEVTAVAIGLSWAALDAYEEMLLTKKTTYPPFVARSNESIYQQYYGRAFGLVDSADSLLRDIDASYERWCRREAETGELFDDEHNRRLMLREQNCVALCWEAVELLFRTAGTAATRTGEKLQRYYRDLSSIRTHLTLQHERTEENFSRVHFGLRPTTNY